MSKSRKDILLEIARKQKANWSVFNCVAAISPTPVDLISKLIQEMQEVIISHYRCHTHRPMVLDFGCGDGRWLLEFNAYFNGLERINSLPIDCVGVDIDIQSAKTAIINAISSVPTYLPHVNNDIQVKTNHFTDHISLIQGDMFQLFEFCTSNNNTTSTANVTTEDYQGCVNDSDGKDGINATCTVIANTINNSNNSTSNSSSTSNNNATNKTILPMPLIIVCYLSRDGNVKLQQLLSQYRLHQSPEDGDNLLTILSVGVRIM